jgi:hypothetical protein
MIVARQFHWRVKSDERNRVLEGRLKSSRKHPPSVSRNHTQCPITGIM